MPDKANESVFMIGITEDFSKSYPGASVGILVLENVRAKSPVSGLEGITREVVLELQNKFPDLQALKDHPVIRAYTEYYKNFRKSYHVLGQLQSIIFGKRPFPSGSALVETMYAAELKNMLLTAIHDLDSICHPLRIGISTGEEIYITLRGEEQRLKPGDMMMRDQAGIISSVIYGPDRRTCVSQATANVILAVYAPVGVSTEAVINYFEDIKRFISLFSPQFKTILQEIYPKDLKR